MIDLFLMQEYYCFYF